MCHPFIPYNIYIDVHVFDTAITFVLKAKKVCLTIIRVQLYICEMLFSELSFKLRQLKTPTNFNYRTYVCMI